MSIVLTEAKIVCPHADTGCTYSAFHIGGTREEAIEVVSGSMARHCDANHNKWAIGKSSPLKVVHRSHCRHAKLPYNWANDYPSVQALAVQLVNSGAAEWHGFCQKCCGDLADAVTAFRDGALDA